MLSRIEDRKGTKDGRGYPALSTRDFVVNNASSWRRTRRSESWQSVRSGWPLAISLSLLSLLSLSTLCLSRAYPLTTVVSRSLFPCPYLSPEPVAHKLIRSRCLLARGLPLATVVTPLALFASSLPSPRLHPTGPRPPFFSFPQGPKYSRKLRDRTDPRRVNPCREDRREGRKEADSRAFNELLAGLAVLRDPLPR